MSEAGALPLDPIEVEAFIEAVIAEDLGSGDRTSQATVSAEEPLTAAMVARESLVVAGLPLAVEVFRHFDPDAEIDIHATDGSAAAAGDALLTISGHARAVLAAERPALNIVQHLSGIATLTRAYVEAIAGTGAVLLDTRKTVPGLRRLAKYATRLGGAQNHRMGLYDAVLIKDNHIAASGGIVQAIAKARAAGEAQIEVECDMLDQARAAVAAGADRLLLDNMTTDELRRAGLEVDGRIPLEASGGVTLENIRAIAETGVDYISVGRITQSAPAVDIGLDTDRPGSE